MNAGAQRAAVDAVSAARVIVARLGKTQHNEDLAADILDAWRSVEAGLRSMLGGSSLSGQPLIHELRQRQLLSLEQANALAEFRAVSERSERTDYTPTDRDVSAVRGAFLKLEAGLKWMPASADANGLLALKPFVPMEPTAVYTLAYVYSPKKQTSTVTLLTDGPTRVWVGDKMGFERVVPKQTPFSQEEKFPVELVVGWNAVLLKTVTSGATHRIGLQFTGDLLRMTATPDDR